MGAGGRNMSYARDALAEFHAVLDDEPARGNAKLRRTLHSEEHEELEQELWWIAEIERDNTIFSAVRDEDRAKLARELADVVYIAFGTAHAFNIDLDAALVEIHRAAMSKLEPPCPNTYCKNGSVEVQYPGDSMSGCVHCGVCGGTGKGKPVIRDDGKVMKPPGFVAPDMSEAVL